MSRRHKENEINNNNTTQQVVSQADSHPESASRDHHLFDGLKFTIGRRKSLFSLDLVLKAILKAFEQDQVVVDGKWVKIPRSCVMDSFTDEEVDKMTSKKGRPFIRRLFQKVEDNKLVGYFKETLHEAKEKCVELYENIAQFAVCFLKGSNKAFSPDDDPYGKLSHYHRILKPEVADLPTRKTLSNYLKWFVDWKPVATCIKENIKEKKERLKHYRWERFIEWIQSHLLIIAPEYVYT